MVPRLPAASSRTPGSARAPRARLPDASDSCRSTGPSPSGAPMSISARKPSVLSGSASKYAAIRSRSAAMSRFVLSTPNCSVSDGSACSSPTRIDASRYVRSGVRCSIVSSPGWLKSTSMTTRSDGASTTSSTNCSCSTWPLSPPTSLI